VDRMVKKKDLPKELKEAWKPLRTEPATVDQREREVAKGEGKAKREAVQRRKKESRQIHRNIKKLDKETVREMQKELEDEEYRIEKILDHNEGKDGSREYKVRFVGYGPNDDLWYKEEDLLETAPEMIAEYEEKVEEEERKLLQERRGARDKKQRRGRPAAGKGQ